MQINAAMPKRISFLVVNHGESTVKRFSVYSSLIYLLLLCVVLAGLCMGVMIYDYLHLQKSRGYARRLEQKVASQAGMLADRQQKIEDLEAGVLDLKSRILALGDLEEQIRRIAREGHGTKGESASGGAFGIGGAMPEDIAPWKQKSRDERDMIARIRGQVRLLTSTSESQRASLATLLGYLNSQKKLFDCTPSICPAHGRITSRFGYRKSPFGGRREIHKGIDIGAPAGTPIMAAADGVVIFVGRKSSFGRTIILDHGRGLTTRYAHCSKILKKIGQRVKKGDIIARMGSTGRSTGPHLHYEVRVNGMAMDPSKFILN